MWPHLICARGAYSFGTFSGNAVHFCDFNRLCQNAAARLNGVLFNVFFLYDLFEGARHCDQQTTFCNALWYLLLGIHLVYTSW